VTEIDRFFEAWRTHRLPKEQWTHAAHVSMCAYVAFDRNFEETLDFMREGIWNYNAAVGGKNTESSGYHETLTHLWVRVIRDYLSACAPTTREEAVRLAVEKFGEDRKLHELYYSFDIVNDRQARREWIPPDRKAL
jgi:hypothetical protein